VAGDTAGSYDTIRHRIPVREPSSGGGHHDTTDTEGDMRKSSQLRWGRDDTASLHSSTLVVFAFVIVLAFVLLLVAFGSVAIPLVSIGLNLLSVGAGYGLITLIFQDGRLQGLLGYTSFGGIISWIPLFMFVLLFGLSMDYHVFILSRIRELRPRGATTPDAVVGGVSSSAGVVTSAAVIMVAVFSILATLPIVDTKTLGIGVELLLALLQGVSGLAGLRTSLQ
jgi:RND superfamily putative drug exporter